MRKSTALIVLICFVAVVLSASIVFGKTSESKYCKDLKNQWKMVDEQYDKLKKKHEKYCDSGLPIPGCKDMQKALKKLRKKNDKLKKRYEEKCP